MAKEKGIPSGLTFFKFKPAEWDNGDVQYCSYHEKGYFMDICSFYWNRKCNMTASELFKKFKETETLNRLIHEEVIKIDEDSNVIIEFLMEQYSEVIPSHEFLSKKGKEGAKKRWKQHNLDKAAAAAAENAALEQPEDGTPYWFYIKLQLHKYKISEYCKREMAQHMEAFMKLMGPVTTEQVLTDMDNSRLGFAFSNHNHVMMTFNSTAQRLKKGDGKVGNNGTQSTKLTYKIKS